MADDIISPEACLRLWCAVLEQAVTDAKRPKPVLRSREGRQKAEDRSKHKNALAQWRHDREYIGSRSFREVCWLCGLDPAVVEQRVRRDMQPEEAFEDA